MFDPAPVRHGAASKSRDAMRILVVDDDPVYRETARMFLSMFGGQVVLAENGSAGLARVANDDFDVMIVDLEMPDMTGLEVIAATRAMPRQRDLPIIMVTSRDDAPAIDRAYELGASSFIVKPVNWTLLDHAIRFVRRAALNEVTARRAHADAEALSRAKDNLISVIRHEMKTPLSAITGFTQLAVEAQRSGDLSGLKEHLEFVRQSGERLMASFLDMSTYSDLIAQKALESPATINPNWILGEAIEHRERAIAQAGLSLVINEEPRVLRMQADQTLLVSAIVRLIDNVIAHASHARTITIASAYRDGRILLSVTDDGIGMPPERVAACLAPFSQETMSLARMREGLGLGLPITTEIVRLHQGQMTMQSQPGQGTQVSLSLPVEA
ncbi:MAG: hybrid sensor histidine kinase/response regulator [Beijerinckiaceae bacterium]|nr:hybrid sensor histidine kinase/response regulator [Beijerinckiaceae bacterium]MCZ8299186.1 hybrid sensor histidine kinase/response regulator [Beijerinckiaceae bacterium]